MKLDARTKLILLALISTLSVLARDLIFLGAALAFALAANLVVRADILSALKRVRMLFAVIVFIALVQSMAQGTGRTLVGIGDFKILSVGGVIAGAEFILRMTVILLAGLVASTSGSSELVDGMIKLRLPYEFAFMTAVAVRFIPMFRDEFAGRLNAIAMRGIDLKRLGIGGKIKVYSYMITPAITGAIIKSRELAESMEARAFRAYNKRTAFRNLRAGWQDWAILAASLMFSVVFLYCNYTFGGAIIII